MSLKQITFKEALVTLARGEKIYLDPEEHKNYPPIYLDDKKGIMNTGYMDLVDFTDEKWFAEEKMFHSYSKSDKKEFISKEKKERINMESVTIVLRSGFTLEAIPSTSKGVEGLKVKNMRDEGWVEVPLSGGRLARIWGPDISAVFDTHPLTSEKPFNASYPSDNHS